MTTRWGIVGLGAMAQMYANDFEHASDATLQAVASRSLDNAQQFAATHGAVSAYGSYDELVGDPDVDVVYIATPHPQHLAIAEIALTAGKPVVVEKAFTATLAGARKLATLADDRGIFCMEAMWTRFQPAVQLARDLIASGAIGDVTMVQADLGAYRTYDPKHRLFNPELGGGATLDLGVYVISIAQHFLGVPDTVAVSGTRYPNGVDASAALLLGYSDGRAASLSYALTTESPGRAVVWGTGGSIELGPRFHHPTQLVVRRNGVAPETIDAPPSGRGYSHQIDHVGQCLAEGRTESPIIPLSDTLAVQGVMQQVLDTLGVPSTEDTSPVS